MSTLASGTVTTKPVPSHGGGRQEIKNNSSRPNWTWALGASLVACFTSLIPRLFSPTFYYWDDMMQSFLPVWRYIGEELRGGRFPLMDPDGWVGGNLIAEVGYGIFNPVNIVNSVLVSMMDDLSWASYFIVVQFIGLLAFGVFMLCREYGARVSMAFAAAVAMPFSGFTLFYEASRWPGGLMAFAWTVTYWWALRRYARRNTSPFLPFLVGFLAMTAGNPYGAIGVIIVLFAVAVESALVRNWARLLPLVLVGAAIGATAVIVYFPLPLSASVTVRTSSVIVNDLFLQPDMSSLLASSTANYLPRLNTFFGVVENVPSSYLAWFTLPLLPWLNFRSISARSRQISSLYVITGVYFLLTFAPSNVLVFRWPLRMIEYAYLGFLVLIVVVASTGLRTTAWKTRMLFTVAIVVFGSYRAWSMVPAGNKVHAAAAAIALCLIAGTGVAYRRFGMRGMALLFVIGTAMTLGFQSRLYIPQSVVAGVGSPTDAGELRLNTQEYKGNTLQIFNSSELSSEEFTSGQILYGNQILNADVDASLGRYSGISFVAYVEALCMNYRAETCPEAFDRVFSPGTGGIDAPLADLLRLQTVVVQRGIIADDELLPPPGWTIASRDSARVVFRRVASLAYPGTVSWASEGVKVESAESGDHKESVSLADDSEAGRVIFARLAWPGYTVKVDGVHQALSQGPAGLIEVRVPTGAKVIDLSYTPPGLAAGVAAQASAWLVISVMTLQYYRQRNRVNS